MSAIPTQAELDPLRRAATELRDAEAAATAAQAAYEAARERVAKARRSRRDALRRVLGRGDTPERMRACALALGISTPRAYQLARDYESQR